MSNFLEKTDTWLYDKGIYHCIKTVLDHWFFKALVIILSCINAYILLVVGSSADAEKFKSNFKFISEIVFNNTGLIVILSTILTGVYVFLRDFLNNRCENIQQKYRDLDNKYDITVKILVQLNRVVAKKRILLAKTTQQHINTPLPPSAKTVFNKIIQPQDQIDILIEALRDCLLSIYQGEIIKVALVSVDNLQIDEWVSYSPYDMRPKTEIVELKDPHSTFSKCISRGKTIIVPNTQIEILKDQNADKMFIQGKSDPSEKWCQVCTPIHSINNSNEIIFIISIAIKRENIIVQENVAFLEWMLDFFKTRLALEHSLKQLKGRVK